VKWFTHDSNLRNTPMMRGIRRDLGEAGYGRAMILLETLAETGGMTEDFCPQLPLDKAASDLDFWAAEFGTDRASAEQTLETFEKFELILPRKERLLVVAPMLGERLADWQRRRRNRARASKNKKTTPQDSTEKKTTPHHRTEQATESLRSDSVGGEERLGRMGVIFSEAGNGLLNSTVGRKEVLALPDTDDAVCDAFKHWLRERDLTGVKYPLAVFAKDYPAARAAVATATKQANQEKELAAQAAELTEKARIAFEEKARQLREEANTPIADGIFG